MKAAPFAYSAPTTLDDALALLHQHGDDAGVLAGGQSLVPLLALRLARFEQLVDLNKVANLAGVRVEGVHVVVGAMTRMAALERDELIARRIPLLHEATRHVGHFQIRNRGTIGGSVALADPAAEYPAVLLALDAEVEIASPAGMRRVAADDFFVSPYATALEPGELITAVRLPLAAAGSGFALEEMTRRHGDFALAGAAAAVTVGGAGSVAAARVAVFAISGRPERLPDVEQALLADSPIDAALDGLEAYDDASTPAEYRRRAGAVMVERAVARALAQATEGARR
jgi:aerobic carbon-monoxide dehydrogenase medium subunit